MLKNRMIKLLGGYTAEEYALLHQPQLISMERKVQTETLCVQCRLDRTFIADPDHAMEAGKFAQKQLVREMQRQIEPYIRFKMDSSETSYISRAYLTVVQEE